MVQREGFELPFRAKTPLKINKNLIFTEFLKIIKNTLALLYSSMLINNTHHLFIVVPKIVIQSDSLASTCELSLFFYRMLASILTMDERSSYYKVYFVNLQVVIIEVEILNFLFVEN